MLRELSSLQRNIFNRKTPGELVYGQLLPVPSSEFSSSDGHSCVVEVVVHRMMEVKLHVDYDNEPCDEAV